MLNLLTWCLMDYIVIITAVTALIGAIATAIYQFRQANNQRKELEIQSKDVTNRAIEAASTIIDDYRAEVKALRDELQESRERHGKELDELRKGREKDKQHILRLQWQVSQMTERIAALETEKEVLESEMEVLKKENEKLRGAVDDIS